MNNRPETGPMQFGEDWPGIFIRGDDCFGYQMAIAEVLREFDAMLKKNPAFISKENPHPALVPHLRQIARTVAELLRRSQQNRTGAGENERYWRVFQMSDTTAIKEQFLKDTATHALKTLRCNDTHRHLQFRNPNSFTYWFDLVTWPGVLVIDGDCGTFVFRRLTDMFEFFREPKMEINPHYWAEKLQSIRREGVKEFSPAKFREVIKEYFESHFYRDNDNPLKAETWAVIEMNVLSAIEDGEHAARQAVEDFDHKGFRFTDFWECSTSEYTHQFIWCLYAIVWGINKFDKEFNQDGTRGAKS